MKGLFLIAALIFSFPVFLFADDTAQKLTLGDISGNVYTNAYFGISIPYPADWNVQDQEANKRLLESGKKMLAGEDTNLRALLDVSDQSSVNFFTLMKYPVGSPVAFNSSFIHLAEKVTMYPGLKSGADYLFQVKKVMTMSGARVKYQFSGKNPQEKISGIDFDTLETKITIGNLSICQKMYAAVMKGYAVAFVISYADDDQKKELTSLMSGISFDKAAQEKPSVPAAVLKK